MLTARFSDYPQASERAFPETAKDHSLGVEDLPIIHPMPGQWLADQNRKLRSHPFQAQPGKHLWRGIAADVGPGCGIARPPRTLVWLPPVRRWPIAFIVWDWIISTRETAEKNVNRDKSEIAARR